MKRLANIMSPEDELSIVVDSGDASVVLKPTSAKSDELAKVLKTLSSGGSTNIEKGIDLAFQTVWPLQVLSKIAFGMLI